MSTLITQKYRNFVAGISQQPSILRHPEQLEKQINGLSTEAGGLQKRPPTLFLKSLANFPDKNFPLVHFIDRDDSERYVVVTDGTGNIKAYNAFTGTPITCNASAEAKQYITCSDPLVQLKMVTIADYTFIVNINKVVQMSSEKTAGWGNQGALINVKSGQYGRKYRVVINGADVCSYETPDGSKAEHVKNINTDYIAQQLENSAKSNGWAVWRGSSCIYLTKVGVTVNSVACYDGYNNQALFGIIRQVQTFTKLPVNAPDGFTCEVMGEKNTNSDDYYVRYDTAKGLWVETCEPGSSIGFDNKTMPHVLVREADGTFTLKATEWTKKETGDDLSNPTPSFVGERINDIFFYRNRLGVLSGENIILSNSSDFFNFWVASATAVRDTDPIDIAVSDNKITFLYQAVSFGEELLAFSADAQFSLKSDGVLTPTNAKINPVTYFSSDIRVKPVGVGRNVYFTARRSNFTSVKEYFTAYDDTDKKDSQDITSHVPSYIPNGVYKLVPSTIDNIILLLDKNAPSFIFVYKFLFLDGVKQQSAWSKWDFGDNVTIYGGTFIESTLYLIIKRGNTVCLENIKLAYNTKDFTKEPYRVYLDSKIEVPTKTLDTSTGITQTDINTDSIYGYNTDPTQFEVVNEHGEILTIMNTTDSIIHLQGDHTNEALFIGIPFTFYMELSTPMIKQVDQGTTDTTADGRLQIQKVWINYEETGQFVMTLDIPTKNIMTQRIHSLYKISNRQKLSEVMLQSGVMELSVQALNTKIKVDIESDSPTPLAIVGGGYQGRYTRRTKVI